MHTNKLITQTSPYLLEHAHNPVNWQPWGNEALQEATLQNKPIIISIGYAACHWCHVMEHQSFADVEVANVMNKHFVCIKIDREERPDLDKIYMDAVQMLTGSGGWPLNVITLPNGQPFYGGTYFAKNQWINILEQIAEIWHTRSNDIKEQAENLTHHIQACDVALLSDKVEENQLEPIFNVVLEKEWASLIDNKFGGFNGAPKFILPSAWAFLLQFQSRNKSEWALKSTENTLTKIYNSGINDHLTGGFARYAVDEKWHIPHFEKMLYDNGLLLSLYAQAYQITQNKDYLDAICGIDNFLSATLMAPNNCFYASVNADSEGEEGQFYVWQYSEIEKLLPPHLFKIVQLRFNLTSDGNWEHGKNILGITQSAEAIAKTLNTQQNEVEEALAQAIELLTKQRQQRIHPTIDDKILTSWNALAIIGFVDAYLAIGDKSYLDKAINTAQSLSKIALMGDGHLYRNIKNDNPTIDGFLDDYAYLALAYINLYQATFNHEWIELAFKLTDYAITHFSSTDHALFYYTQANATNLIARKTEVMDNVTPSSNSVMAEVLIKLGIYYRRDDFTERAMNMVNAIVAQTIQSGPYYGNWNRVMGMLVNGLDEITITGNNNLKIANTLQKNYLPYTLYIDGQNNVLPITQHSKPTDDVNIQICTKGQCHLPFTSINDALVLLSQKAD